MGRHRKKKEAERRQTLVLPAAPSGAALPGGAARLSASHHGSHQRESSSLRLNFRPCFLGRGLNGCYPPSPVPAQGNTPRPGHSAGRLMPEAARERGVWPRPQAPHSPRPPGGTLPRGGLGERDSEVDVTEVGTVVKRYVTNNATVARPRWPNVRELWGTCFETRTRPIF